MSSTPLTDTLRETLVVFEEGGEPRTTTEVADQFDLGRRSAYERLERLVDHDRLETKKVGGNGRVWWRPSANGRATKMGVDAQDGLFQALVDATEEYAIFLLDPEGQVQTWNPGAERIKGYEADEIVGEHFSTFYTEDDCAAGVPEKNLTRAAQNGSIEDEGWRVRADGSEFWANVTISAIHGDGGEIEGYAKVTRDMTDRREYERQLEEQADRLERQRDAVESELDEVFDRISDGFYALDEALRFRYLNDHAADVLELDETAVGADIRDKVILTETFESALNDALEAQAAVTFEDYYGPVDGWYYNAIYPSESGLSVYFHEITEQKQRERELARYETIVETAHDGIYVLDEERRFELVNDSFADLTSFSRAELRGRHASTVFGDEFTSIEVEQWGDAAPDAPPVFEETIDGDPNEIRTVENRFIIVGEGTRERRIGVVRDVTERNEYRRQLEESNERLEQFAYAVSHDLQEPLRMVTSYLQLIDQRYGDALEDDGEEFLEFAVDGAERMRQMIDGLLEYSRVETQGDSFEPVDLDAVFDEIRDDLQIRIDETDADVTADDLPTVTGDASQLRQVFQNLLDNAIEYSGDEPPRIDIAAERAGDRWRIAVHDHGIGIAPDDHDRVFEVFQRLHTSDEHPGTGIGLALCQRIVERHDGEMWVESEAGEGTTFLFTLPVL